MFTYQNVFSSLLVRPQLVAVKTSYLWLFSKSIGLEDKCQLLSFLSWWLSPFKREFKALYFILLFPIQWMSITLLQTQHRALCSLPYNSLTQLNLASLNSLRLDVHFPSARLNCKRPTNQKWPSQYAKHQSHRPLKQSTLRATPNQRTSAWNWGKDSTSLYVHVHKLFRDCYQLVNGIS